MALGDGKMPVKFLIIPLSTRFNAELQCSSIGRATEGMLSSFFTNFYCESDRGHFLLEATSFLNAATSRGGGRGADPPLEAMVVGNLC